MNEVRTGRSLEHPTRIVRSATVLRGFAALHRGLPCEWCWAADLEGVREFSCARPFEEINHILGGSRRTDADWNLSAVCRQHHRHPEYGFHGAKPYWTPARAFALKRFQGYVLPRVAWGYLPEGYDAGPPGEPVQAANRVITARVCDELRAWSF